MEWYCNISSRACGSLSVFCFQYHPHGTPHRICHDILHLLLVLWWSSCIDCVMCPFLSGLIGWLSKPVKDNSPQFFCGETSTSLQFRCLFQTLGQICDFHLCHLCFWTTWVIWSPAEKTFFCGTQKENFYAVLFHIMKTVCQASKKTKKKNRHLNCALRRKDLSTVLVHQEKHCLFSWTMQTEEALVSLVFARWPCTWEKTD